jgi:hypothetical protein
MSRDREYLIPKSYKSKTPFGKVTDYPDDHSDMQPLL